MVKLLTATEGVGLDGLDVVNAFKDKSIREYSYLFTGRNIDIIDLNLDLANIVKAGHQAYTNLVTTTAAADRSAIQAQPPNPSASKTTAADSPSSRGATQVTPQAKLTSTGALGVPKSFIDTEAMYKSLLPEIFGYMRTDGIGQVGILNIDMEILGDPGLMPTSEATLSSNHLARHYANYAAKAGDSSQVLSGYDPTFFRFIYGNPDPNTRENEAYGGYYQFMKVIANFKDSGAFTMNVNGKKDQRVGLVSKEAVEKNKARAEKQANDRSALAQGDNG
jgi:hypothetical protein